MTEEEKHQIRSRINRLNGQVTSLNRLLESRETSNFIIQNQAVIAAAKAVLAQYVEVELLNKENLSAEEKKELLRLIRKQF